MSVRQTIETKIRSALAPSHLEVINESYMHSVPPGSESHFRVVVVSERFEDLPLVRRHQRVNRILEQELQAGLHALSLQTLTVSEWTRRGGETLASPACLGGSKADT
ncbi:MAG: BolA/IbaG family iron-sulfur metabolism protein [Kiloniellales bacterium]